MFELSPQAGGGWAETVLLNFGGENGSSPYSSLIFDAAGNLYGTTQTGGALGGGTVFELSPAAGGGWTQTVLYNFSNQKSRYVAAGSLTFDAAGNLYARSTAATAIATPAAARSSSLATRLESGRKLSCFSSTARTGSTPTRVWSSTLPETFMELPVSVELRRMGSCSKSFPRSNVDATWLVSANASRCTHFFSGFARNLYPTPRTVSKCRGCTGSSSM